MSSAQLLFLSPVALPRRQASFCPSLHRQTCRAPKGPAMRGAPPPPKVKSSYYKNPSKAIEKGGGFYIPGLRGPRLRVAVSLLSGALLGLNYLSAGNASAQSNLHVSEALAAAGCAAVLATAAVDLAAERAGTAATVEAAAQAAAPVGAVAPQVAPEGALVADAEAQEAVAWAVAVVTDLTRTRGIALCRDGRVLYATGQATEGGDAGEAVRRVAAAGRDLYIDDSSTLPPEVTFPFLEAGNWALFLVAAGGRGDVVVFAGDPGKGGYEKGDRAWLQQMAIRIVQGFNRDVEV